MLNWLIANPLTERACTYVSHVVCFTVGVFLPDSCNHSIILHVFASIDEYS